MLYARINQETNEVLEFPIFEVTLRDRLSNTTLPDTITDFHLAGTNYVCVEAPAVGSINLKNTETHTISPTSAKYVPELEKFIRLYELVEVPVGNRAARNETRLKNLRKRRKEAFAELDAKILQVQSEIRLGLTPSADIAELDAKAQTWRDMTSQNIWDIDEQTFFVL